MRTQRTLAILTAAVLGITGTAHANTPKLPVRPAAPLFAPTVIRGECPQFAGDDTVTGCYVAQTNTVFIDTGLGTMVTREVTEHEMGHAVDAQSLTDQQRLVFDAMVHAPHGQWHSTDGVTGTEEKFADAYMSCRLRRLPVNGIDWATAYHYLPRTDAAQRTICRTIAGWVGTA